MSKLAFLCAVLLLVGCQPGPPRTDHVLEAPRTELVSDTSLFGALNLTSRRSVRDFYQQRGDSLFWMVQGKRQPSVDSLLSILTRTESWGLPSRDYHLDEINSYQLDSLVHQDVERVDLLLSDAYITLFQHLREGVLDPKSVNRRDLSRTTNKKAIASLAVISKGSPARELKEHEPTARQYALLKQALKNYDVKSGDSVAWSEKSKILVNMERWRWEERWPQRYLFVNIPAFTLYAVEDDSTWLASPVIVGKRQTPTPVMESVVKSFTIYPYWHAPYSIATQELLPVLRKDASYLERKNFQVLYRGKVVMNPDTIQWQRYSAEKFPFVLRQREGSENTMGIIKFSFSNPYNVYLHDTNSKVLFRHERRDLSHGCVRVQQAVALAHYLVREDDIYVSPEDLDQYLSLQQRLDIDLRKPIAIKLKYFTAEVHDGDVFFYADVYGRDSVMMEALWPADHGKAEQGPVF